MGKFYSKYGVIVDRNRKVTSQTPWESIHLQGKDVDKITIPEQNVAERTNTEHN
jgi:hypothetical protein